MNIAKPERNRIRTKFGSRYKFGARYKFSLGKEFSSGYAEGETPVPIPNTAVKPFEANGTAGVILWESRKSLD